jgi:hypothetical protein
VSAGRLLRVVGRGVAPDHVGRGVAEQSLDVELARVLFDRPGGEGVSEAVGVDLGQTGLAAEPTEHLLEAVGAERDAGLEDMQVRRGEEERPVFVAAKLHITQERLPAACGEGDDALLVALAMEHPQPAAVQVQVFEAQLDELGAADARIEQGKEDRLVARAGGSRRVATAEQVADVVRGEGSDDALWKPDVLERPERTLSQVAGMNEPIEEAAHLAEVTVARLEGVAAEAAEIGIKMVGCEAGGIEGKAFVIGDAQEAGQRLAVGANRVGGLALDLAT